MSQRAVCRRIRRLETLYGPARTEAQRRAELYAFTTKLAQEYRCEAELGEWLRVADALTEMPWPLDARIALKRGAALVSGLTGLDAREVELLATRIAQGKV
jgi:hypothetical protein